MRARALRRLWWALLPYEGWVSDRRAGLPDPPGSTSPPWYAFPLAWVWRWVDGEMDHRDFGKWGPQYNGFTARPDNWREQPKPWQ